MCDLNMYMGFSRGAGPFEGAALIFANTAREAKKIGYRGIGWDLTGGDFLDFGIKRIKGADYLLKEADQIKLEAGIPHVIDAPRCCSRCEMWGNEILENGLCTDCALEDTDGT